MTVRLSQINDQTYSLEFDVSDIKLVEAAIKTKYGKPKTKTAGIATIYEFGGCDFTFQNQWEDPCLISDNVEGHKILEELNGFLNS